MQKGAAPQLVGRVEQEGEGRFEPVGDFRLVRSQRSVGRDDADYWRDGVASDRPVLANAADDVDSERIEPKLLVCLAQGAGDRLLSGVQPAAASVVRTGWT